MTIAEAVEPPADGEHLASIDEMPQEALVHIAAVAESRSQLPIDRSDGAGPPTGELTAMAAAATKGPDP